MIVYDTREETGTTKNFAKQVAKLLKVKAINVQDVPDDCTEEYILCTYTAGLGEVPKNTVEFLDKHHERMVAVVANGSSNFNKLGLFAKSGDRISNKYVVELLRKLDMGGTSEDIKYVARRSALLMGITLDDGVERVKPMSTFVNGQFTLQRI